MHTYKHTCIYTYTHTYIYTYLLIVADSNARSKTRYDTITNERGKVLEHFLTNLEPVHNKRQVRINM